MAVVVQVLALDVVQVCGDTSSWADPFKYIHNEMVLEVGDEEPEKDTQGKISMEGVLTDEENIWIVEFYLPSTLTEKSKVRLQCRQTFVHAPMYGLRGRI